MSCITKILEVKGDKPILIFGEIAIEGGGVFKGYEYLITFTSRGHRCGYVAVPESHPLHTSKEEYPEYEVHGGITFFEEPRFEEITKFKCTDKWLGFDAAHVYDASCFDTVKKYFAKPFNATSELEKKFFGLIESMSGHNENELEGYNHRTYAYMKNECRLLINQLRKQELSHAA